MTGKIIIAGDLFPIPDNAKQFSDGDIKTLFGEEICKLFSEANLSICNLEGALTDHQDKCVKTGPIKTAPTSAVKAYKELGINCCLLANNHATDGGHQGMTDTMQVLDKEGIDYIGAGKDATSITKSIVYTIGSMKIGLYNVSETMYNKPTKNTAGAWLYDEYIVCRDIESLKKVCDYLIVVYHGGIEKFPYPSPETKKRFYRMADNGADMILAQHTHCIGCEENYNGSYLLYGQGDFLLKNYLPGRTDSGLIIELDIDGSKVNIKKHRVECFENRYVRYSESQDLKDFYERSEKLKDEEYVSEQFHQFCQSELHLYLKAFKSHGRMRYWMKRYFPKKYKKWLHGEAFTRRDLMFALHTLRSEQNRETAIVGIEDLLKMN